MKPKLLILSIFICGIVNAQSPNWSWAKSAGGTSSDYGNSIVVDASGNTYVTGNFMSTTINFGSTTLTNTNPNGSYYDISLAKYDVSGNLLWAKSAGGMNSEHARSIAVDAMGNTYITGIFKVCSFDSITLTAQGYTDSTASYSDIFLAKYDASGNVLWARSAGGTQVDDGSSVAVDTSGNAYITGTFNSPSIIFGSDTLSKTNSVYEDIFLAKYDASGNVIWAKRAGGTGGVDVANSVAVDVFGNAFITGSFKSPTLILDSVTLTNATACCSQDVFLAKYDASGNALWAKRAGGTGSEYASSVSVDAYGNPYITGTYSGSSLNFDTIILLNASNSFDTFLAKYDASGNVLWAKSAGGTGEEHSNSVAVDTMGNAYIAGVFASASILFGTTSLTNPSTYSDDIFLAKYSPLGNILWAKSVGGEAGCAATSIAVDAFENAYITGSIAGTTYSFHFGSTALTGVGYQDVFLAKLNGSISTKVIDLSDESNVSIFPNPANGIFSIQSGDKISTVEIENIFGEKIYSATIYSNTTEIDLSNHPGGVYFISMKTEKGAVNKKLIINK